MAFRRWDRKGIQYAETNQMVYYFIVNPGSRTGHGQALWNELQEKLDRSKIEYEAYFTKGHGDATEIAKQICAEHPEMKRIVIVGGDGTANQAVNGLSNYSKIILGYIPTGSSNDLARGLNIPLDPMRALARVVNPVNFKKVDHCVAEFEDGSSQKFAVSSGIGYDADICYEANKSGIKNFLNKLHIGKIIYFIFGIKLIFTNKRAKTTIIIDGKRKLKYNKLLFATAMNTKYEGGGMPMGPSADPTDGMITLTIVHDISRLKHMKLMTTISKAAHVKYSGVEQITCKTAEIIADRPLVVHTDGEFAGKHSKVVYSCLPDQIRMML